MEESREDQLGSQDSSTEKKGRLIKVIKGVGTRIYETFRDYPVTMLCIILAAFAGALRIGDNYLEDVYPEVLERIIMFCLIMAVQTLFAEEVLKERLRARIGSYIIASVIAGISVFVIYTESILLFGCETDIIKEWITRFLAAYGVIMVCSSIYHMYRRLEEDFEVYCTKAFLGLVKASVVYGLFAVGLAIIVFIFNELIFDTDDFLEQLELFLSGGIYVPMCLKAISGKNEKAGKFARLCVVYVLQSMLLIAFAIIYVYIIKIFVTDSVPSNQVFSILAFLFAAGAPIWTMVHGIRTDEGDPLKASAFLPYVFVPFVGLQAWSMGLRISEYGYTRSRYAAVVFMMIEAVYFLLYLIRRVTKSRSISWILFVLMAAGVLTMLAPRISYDSVVIRSQMRRMETLMAGGDMTEKVKRSVGSAYGEIREAGYRGERALRAKYTDNMLEEMKGYSGYQYRDETIYLYWRDDYAAVNISGYSTLYTVSSNSSDETGPVVTLTARLGQESFEVPVDLTETMEWIAGNFNRHNESQFSLEGRQKVRVDENTDLNITYFSITYNVDTGEAEHLSIGGYLLCR